MEEKYVWYWPELQVVVTSTFLHWQSEPRFLDVHHKLEFTITIKTRMGNSNVSEGVIWLKSGAQRSSRDVVQILVTERHVTHCHLLPRLHLTALTTRVPHLAIRSSTIYCFLSYLTYAGYGPPIHMYDDFGPARQRHTQAQCLRAASWLELNLNVAPIQVHATNVRDPPHRRPLSLCDRHITHYLRRSTILRHHI